MSHSVLPEIGQVFRSIATGAGLRPRLVELGLDKDLDDLALGSRPSCSADLLLGLENRIQRDLASDCGARWAQLLRWHWSQTREVLQQLAREVETTPLAVENGASVVREGFTAPMLAWVIRFAVHHFPGIDLGVWWRSPVEAWVKLVASVAKVDESEVIDRLFTRGFRGQAAIAVHPSGMGLGLYVAQTVARAHGSSISVASAPLGYEIAGIPQARNSFSFTVKNVVRRSLTRL